MWGSLKPHQDFRQSKIKSLTSLRYLRKISAVIVFHLSWDGRGWTLIDVFSLISSGSSKLLTSFFCRSGIWNGAFFNKGITVLPRFKKGLLMYINNNAYKLFGPVIAATHLHSMFIFKVDFGHSLKLLVKISLKKCLSIGRKFQTNQIPEKSFYFLNNVKWIPGACHEG